MKNRVLKLTVIILSILIIFSLYPLTKLFLTDTRVAKLFLFDYYFVEILSDENDFEVFKEYMHKRGWEEVDRLGGLHVFEKGKERKRIMNTQIKTVLIEGKLNLDYFKRFSFNSVPKVKKSLAFFKAIIMPVKTGELFVDSEKYVLVLPKYSSLLENKGDYQRYITLTTGKKLRKYYYNQLPSTGWEFKEQLGSAFIFNRGDKTLISTRRGLIRGIELITYKIIDSNNF